MSRDNTDIANQLLAENAALKAQLAALTAENVALKGAIESHKHGFMRCECCGEDNLCHNDDVCRVLDETPATDAAANVLRAEGVEMWINQLNGVAGWTVKDAKKFASQLREGE